MIDSKIGIVNSLNSLNTLMTMLQVPQVLARIPKSLSAVDNGPLAADVFTLVKGKKRKRSELAVAVNGEAINLYDVRSYKAIFWFRKCY